MKHHSESAFKIEMALRLKAHNAIPKTWSLVPVGYLGLATGRT